MKKLFVLFTLFGIIICSNATTQIIENHRPADFINVQQYIPQIQFDIRYASSYNFVGRPIVGYNAPVCLLTKSAADALKKVELKLLEKNLTLKIYDCYRPQVSVDDFAKWALQLDQTQMKIEFYPTVDKSNLFKDEYISYHSGHSRGSTIDLTIVPLESKIPKPPTHYSLCTNPQDKRSPDNSLDFGTGFDCFSPTAHPDYKNLSPEIKKNRQFLQLIMKKAGFRGIKEEWWHFTLNNEPYPNTYFNFTIEK